VNIDTDAIRRLRDNLIGSERADHSPSAASEALKTAVVRRLQPFAETMYLVMVADGRTDPAEITALIAALSILCGGQLEEAELAALLDRFSQTASTTSVEPRIAQLGAVLGGDRDDRETAFMLAAVIALADDRVDSVESSVLETIAEYFGISSRRANDLLNDVG